MTKTIVRSVCFLAVLRVATVALGLATVTPTRSPTGGAMVTATRTPTIGVTVTPTRTPTGGATVTRTPTAGVSVTRTVTAVAGGTPTSADQCKDGGWRTFTSPRFKNQGDCVSFVASQGRAGGNPKASPTPLP